MPEIHVEVSHEEPDSHLAERLLGRYYAELDELFPSGFDLALTVAAPVADLTPPRGSFLIAWTDGIALGCGGVRRLAASTAEIKRMWVDPTARGKGVGRLLLTALEDVASSWGCDILRLDTSAHLTRAVGLYRSAGYLAVPAYNTNPYAAHWFEKRLT